MATETTPPELFRAIHDALRDPGKYAERQRILAAGYVEPQPQHEARAVLEAVRPFLAGPTPDGQVPLSLDTEQWDLAIDALQQAADEDDDPADPSRGQRASDLAVLLRNKIDRLMPGTYGGCDD